MKRGIHSVSVWLGADFLGLVPELVVL